MNAASTLWEHHEYLIPSRKHQSLQSKHVKCNQEPGGPLNRKPQATRTSRSTTKHAVQIMIQISCDENVKIKNKTRNTDLEKKNHSHETLAPRSRAQHLLDKQRRQSTETILSNNKTSASCNNNNKDLNYHVHFDKKNEVRLCCCGVPCKSDHRQPSQVKREKRKRHFFNCWTTILILQTPS